MRYLDVCSGISAPTVAWKPLGWKCAAYAEIDKFPSAVLKHHYPDVPNLGDMSKIKGEDWKGKIDLIVGGCPCQSFSVAGLRKSLSDNRGNLTLKFVELIHATDVEYAVYENVPGILSAEDNAFGCFLGGLVGADSALVPARGQRWTDAGVVDGPRRTAAWRILDAKFFGVPQRRRRVFVVSVRGAGDWRCAEALFPYAEGLHGNTEARGKTRKDASEGFGVGSEVGVRPRIIAPVLNAHFGDKQGLENQHRLDGAGLFVPHVAGTFTANNGGGGRSTSVDDAAAGLMIPVAFTCKDSGQDAGEVSPTLRAMGHRNSHANAGGQIAVAIQGSMIGRRDEAGPQGIGVDDSGAMFTLTKADIHAVAIQNATRGKDQRGLGVREDGPMYTLDRGSQHAIAIQNAAKGEDQNAIAAFKSNNGSKARSIGYQEETSPTIGVENGVSTILSSMQVRRLTPVECERLMGFPDGFTKISEKTADGSRYKALGNSMAVPCISWLGKRIQMVEDVCQQKV